MSLVDLEVLVLDDSEDMRTLLRKILEGAGMRVTEAASVAEAVKKTEHRIPHLVLCDLLMPKESGFVFLEHRRRSTGLRTVPVIVLSAIGDERAVYRAASLGANQYILKPIVASQLLQKIRRQLRERLVNVYRPPREVAPTITATLPARVTMAGDTGFLVESLAKLGNELPVKIACELLTGIGFPPGPYRTTVIPAALGAPGQFQKSVAAVGLSEEAIRAIRAQIGAWK